MNPSVIQGAKPTALDIGFLLLPHGAKPAATASLTSPSQQQPSRLNPKIVGLFHGVNGLCVLGLVARIPGEVLVLGCTHLSIGSRAQASGEPRELGSFPSLPAWAGLRPAEK